MIPIHRLFTLILYRVMFLALIIEIITGYYGKLTGDVSPFASPVMKLLIPTTRHTNHDPSVELELKLYNLIRRERARLKGLQKIASTLDSQITDLTQRAQYIQQTQHK
ncbi:hypothetical protein BMR1_02g00790 [Babesia microti strain RI]|uniref:Uncharacterized protein n=1 Tax=Babesia microti (strain RI) TaxID=1133968 RepID=A0A1R4AA20_BABMR|nr:hypothetical protein BMR1_02g00790 [Babesia microti strain RI]SJK85839.1 hypothetical protein BMR1_02g00790 [Babesia microti strain RI]|eukprot:XP_021338055.1 hypothetical protein BMR1_02g00790 [Babesia microti strain RI]